MLARREGSSDFLDKIVAATEEGVKKTASSTNHPAEKTASEVKEAKTSHPAERAAAENATEKKAADEVTAAEAAAVTTIAAVTAPEKVATVEEKKSMSLHEVRVARRAGAMVKVAGRNDLYQEAKTESYWKLSDDHQMVVRAFKDENGLVK
jgi:predicted NBD/HSP70 family sugar kinase